MATKLEQMVELWADKFLPLIDEYEDIEYILNPAWNESNDPSNDGVQYYWTWFSDIRAFFKITDTYYKLGYTHIIITTLKCDGGEFDFEGYFIKNE